MGRNVPVQKHSPVLVVVVMVVVIVVTVGMLMVVVVVVTRQDKTRRESFDSVTLKIVVTVVLGIVPGWVPESVLPFVEWFPPEVVIMSVGEWWCWL